MPLFILSLSLSFGLSTGSDEDEISKSVHRGSGVTNQHNGTTDSENGDIQIKRIPPDVIPLQSTEHMMEEAPPYMNGDFSERESQVETDSSEEMNMAPHRTLHSPPPPSKYTDREDMVGGYFMWHYFLFP